MTSERTKVLQMTQAELTAIFNDKSLSPQDRGEIGEKAVTRLGVYWASNYKDHLWQSSYIFPQGIISPTTNSEEAEPVTEIDLLIVTPYRIFVIEIKTVYGRLKIYENSEMEITTDGNFTEEFESKNYFQQNEMHARHLYYHLHQALPDGSHKYLVPLVVVAGKMSYIDSRPDELQEQYPITTASNLYSELERLNTPLDNLLDLNKIKGILSRIRVKDKQRLLNSQKFK